MERKVRKDEGVRKPVAARDRQPGEPDDPEKLRRAEEELPDDGVAPDQPTYPPPPPEGTETTEPVRERDDREAGNGKRSG
jgi:hypothetical protein